MTGPVRLKAVIVDDEAPARALMLEYLRPHADIEVVAQCCNGFEAVKAVSELHPDILFLDIQMPKLNGFEVLELIDRDAPTVIFTTAHNEFAIRAFEVHAVDYLLKPYSAERFADALQRARERARSREPAPFKALIQSQRDNVASDRILIRDRANVHVIPIDRIDYIESQDDYVSIHSAGRSHLKEQTLAELEKELEARGFVRIHRRYLLNITRLSRIELSITESRSAILTDGTELPISKSGYAKLRELL
jgi:two-component system LytT family response regulator